MSAAADEFSGRLVLLEDSRITTDLDKLLWGSVGPEMALDSSDPRYKTLTEPPLRSALLQLQDDSSNTIAEMKLERALARVRTVSLHPGFRTILVTTDMSAGFGSYSGPFTQLFEVRGGKFQLLRAADTSSGKSEEIRLANTLKTSWELFPVSGSPGTTKDILEVACRPNEDASVFYVTYARYHWSGKAWLESSSRVQGMWEAGEPFPPATSFPSGKD